MSNPAFNSNPAFTNNPNRAQSWSQQQGQQFGQQFGGQQQQYGQASPSAQQLNDIYDRPAATPQETGRMSIDGTIVKTAMTLGVVAIGFVVTMATFFAGLELPFYALTYGGALVGFVLALVNIFKREPSRGLILAYALAQGFFLGGISTMFEFLLEMPGIIMQALIATACVFGATLALYAFRIVRTSPRLTKIFFIALIGYALFSLVNVIMMWTGATQHEFGMRTMEVFGIPLGLILGVLAVLLGAYSLVMDFEMTENGVKRGAPAKYEWSAAFGITVTIIWLYIEILRIIAILRR
ncbi:Bax inhibitor-1/YccA family protein [uncultured Agrococcus sp.]|uniref:Bax inhibitor-1/YccA family protein n=1 Tax=uncultured Agrococcus sp. TaxID=382258 RepID=UPI0025E43841|nr:Bax inhibitor-1/YccA family protein [uncultured Agrococcus sp.]